MDTEAGVILGSVDTAPRPRHGERAAMIRKLSLRYPELGDYDIARKVGCDPANVTRVLQRFSGTLALDDLAEFQANRADVYDALQHRALASITDTHLSKSSALQLVTVAAILEDKRRLTMGQPTSIHVTALVDLVQVLRERRNEQE